MTRVTMKGNARETGIGVAAVGRVRHGRLEVAPVHVAARLPAAVAAPGSRDEARVERPGAGTRKRCAHVA